MVFFLLLDVEYSSRVNELNETFFFKQYFNVNEKPRQGEFSGIYQKYLFIIADVAVMYFESR